MTAINSNDIAWREYNIHGELEEDNAFDLFASNDLCYEDFSYTLTTKDKSNKERNHSHPSQGKEANSFPKLQLRVSQDYSNSTGTVIWKGAEIMSEYLQRNPTLVRGKRVLELGAGVGLCGLVAHHLGASHVCLTDGDESVLSNLRLNVRRNLYDSDSDRDNDSSSTSFSSSASSLGCISCPQLIWGFQLEDFQNIHGQFQVIVATDCIYMTHSLFALFATVHAFLKEDGLFLYCNVCASQVPPSTALETAAKHGFSRWSQADDDDRIYVFRRDK